jgi:DNA-binding CsgD family transcriptional regulator
MSIINSGLYYINEDLELVRDPVPEFISKLRIRYIYEVNNDTSVFFTEDQGLYLKAGDVIKELNASGNLLLKSYQINRVIVVNDSLLAVGTIKQGLFIIDHAGNIKSHIDKSNGLQNNSILALMIDQNGNLWLGLDKGIDYAEITSPVSIIEDKTGKLGSVSCSVLRNGKLYLGTNHGLFYADWDRLVALENTEFNTVPIRAGHAISLDIIDGKLYCGFNLGTYIIEENSIIRLSDIGGGSLMRHPFLENVAYQGIYTGIGLYKRNGSDNWAFAKVLLTNDYTKYIQIDQEGNLWSSSYFKGVQMHQLNNSGDSIINTISFGKEDGFISDYYINVFKLGNRIIFSNGGIFFTYDYLARKIVPFDWLNNQLGDFKDSHILYNAGNSEYWFINRSSLGLFHYVYDSLVLKYEIKYNNIHYSAMEYTENVSRINEQNYIIGLDEGFAILDYRRVMGSTLNLQVKSPRINRIQFLSQSGVPQKVPLSSTYNPHIPFKNRNCLVNFSVPGTTQVLFIFYYRFSHLESWTSLGNTCVLRYNNLSSGSHLLEIKAVEGVTGKYSIVTYPFTISSPFYFHWIAFIVYFIFLSALGLLALKILRKQMERHKWEFSEKTRIENEKKIAEMNQEYLKMELRNKSKELVNYTILLDKRNELLGRLKSIINKDFDDTKAPPKQLNLKLLDFIDKNISNRNEWQIFKSHFDAANSEFLDKLKNAHNSLTPSDLRFCAFLRMNLTSKEISSLLSISLRSVEVKRYRLRKKLNLKHDKNLIEYLMNA